MDELLQEFIAETRETAQALAGEIVAWEANPTDRARLDAIFRFVHTVKGSCGFLDLPRLARLSHAAEDALMQVRDDNRQPDTQLVNAVLAIVDRISEIVEAIDSGSGLDDSGEDLLIAALDPQATPTAAAPTAAATTTTTQAPRVQSRSVRLSVDLLDRMMSGMTEMVLARNELARRLRDCTPDPSAEAALERLSLTVAEMRDTVTRTRMQPIDALFSALPRVVRDTAAAVGKAVALQIEGGDVELDREMIELMRDPLVHMIRNSIDHGIEDPASRRAAGKPQTGRLSVSARQSGNRIVVEIADDGNGIDIERVVAKLVSNGARDAAELRALSDAERLQLIFEPGLSTKEEVTEISGRGVGMDVVKANIESIGGRIEIENAPGKGLRLAIHVPLTLSIISTIGIRVGGQRFALPRQAIEEIVSAHSADVRHDRLGDARIVAVRDRRMPLVELGAMLGLAAQPLDRAMLAIIQVSGGSYALAVDEITDTEELVVKPAAPAVMACGVYGGQTLPDSGQPMLLIDGAGVAQAAGLVFTRTLSREEEEVAGPDNRTPALLFVDLDGTRRAVAVGLVDRVELVESAQISRAAGLLRLAENGRTVPVVAQGELPADETTSVLRLSDGAEEVAYVIAEACDIVALDPDLAPPAMPGLIAGVALVEDQPIEVIDGHWLFAEHGEGRAADAPLCLIADDASGWMANVLKPVLEGAGYRVATQAGKETPAVVLAMEDDAQVAHPAAPVLRLRRRKAGSDDSIYRYDRAGVLAALAAAGGRA